MNVIYYFETNLICIVVLVLLRSQLRQMTGQYSADKIAFVRLLRMTVLLCVSDMVAGSLRGYAPYGARWVIQISNCVFFEALAVISYLWMRYVFIKLRVASNTSGRAEFLWALPLIIFTLLTISNPITHVLFSLDASNVYARGYGVYFHWFVTWLYLIVPTVRTAWVLFHEKNKQRRNEIYPLLYFIIAPIAASTVQMCFYGVTSSQVGITISILMIYLTDQSNQVLTDALTGLNNRRGLDNYLNDHVLRHCEAPLSLVLLDLNDFKQINDRHGHIEGDRALQETSAALKEVCSIMSGRLFLCRFGGDEFLIAGTNRDEVEIAKLCKHVHDELNRINLTENNPYVLEVSIGTSLGRCSSAEDVSRLLRKADEAMYADKARWRSVTAKQSFQVNPRLSK